MIYESCCPLLACLLAPRSREITKKEKKGKERKKESIQQWLATCLEANTGREILWMAMMPIQLLDLKTLGIYPDGGRRQLALLLFEARVSQSMFVSFASMIKVEWNQSMRLWHASVSYVALREFHIMRWWQFNEMNENVEVALRSDAPILRNGENFLNLQPPVQQFFPIEGKKRSNVESFSNTIISTSELEEEFKRYSSSEI